MLVGNGPYGVRRRQPVTGGARPARAAVWASKARSRQTPASSSVEPLLGHALGVEAHRQRRRDRLPSSTRLTSGDATRRPGLPEGAVLLHREGGEAEVPEHVHQVHHRVVVEHDRVVAGRDVDRVGRRPGAVRGLAPDGGGIDRRSRRRRPAPRSRSRCRGPSSRSAAARSSGARRRGSPSSWPPPRPRSRSRTSRRP